MTERIMTTKELAEYIKLNEKTVIKMAQKGNLPGVKIGSQWRFHLETVDAFLQKQLLSSTVKELDTVIRTSADILPLSRLVNDKTICLDLQAKTKNTLLVELADLAVAVGITKDRDRLLNQLRQREGMLSTAVGQGVAIPHPRNPSTDLFPRPALFIARSKEGIYFDAPDQKPVYLFLMTCSPNEFYHLRLLAQIAKLLHRRDVLPRFLAAVEESDIMKVLMEFERDTFLSGNVSGSPAT